MTGHIVGYGATMDTLDVDIIPGTEIMRDGDTHFAHAHGMRTGSV